MKNSLTQLFQFLNVSNWCRGHWYKDKHNIATLNDQLAAKFDILGAIGHLFDGKTAQQVKSYLEAHLQLNAPTFLPALFVIPKKPDGTPGPNTHRIDYSNLAKFNDEMTFLEVNRFLKSASEVAQ